MDNTAVLHCGINAIISNGTLAEGITMTIDELGKSAVSDINCIAEISPVTPGSYNVQFTGGHYVPKPLKLTVAKGKMLQVSVVMGKA